MKRICTFWSILIFVFSSFYSSSLYMPCKASDGYDEIQYIAGSKRDLLCIMLSYQEYVSDIEKNSNGDIFLVMKSGKRILYDDKKIKNFNEKLQNGDLQDMMEQIYPLNDIDKVLEDDYDPGRVRVYALLNEVYGGNLSGVQKNLVNTNAGYKNLLFNKNNGASRALTGAMKELAASDGRTKAAVFPVNGTFNYRKIAGTNQLSPHSFGIAIDLVTQKNDYWKWGSRTAADKRISTYPKNAVHIFEKYNFIWGGKWSHFDIMHYEYRPELIMKSKYFSKPISQENKWYDGIPINENTQKYIELIDSKI